MLRNLIERLPKSLLWPQFRWWSANLSKMYDHYGEHHIVAFPKSSSSNIFQFRFTRFASIALCPQ
jgi:hypothetical protein